MNGSKSFLIYGMLISVILIWGLAWPISKIGLADMSPMWFTFSRLMIGFITLFLVLLIGRKIVLPKLRDLPFILSIGVIQMAAFLLLINSGLQLVDAGRSAILVYSTPFIVTPIAVLLYKEHINIAKLMGLMLGFIGLMVLFNPNSFNWHDSKAVLGNSLLLLAAFSWGIGMLHTRYGTWHSPPLLLAPWQLLLASLIVLLATWIVEPKPNIHWNHALIFSILYNGILSTGVAYPMIMYVSQRLPVTTTSLLMLGVPIVGLISSAIWLHEPLTASTLIAMALIVGGLGSIALDRTPKISYD